MIRTSTTVCALGVPVPSLDKEGGLRQWSLLQNSVVKLQLLNGSGMHNT